MPSAFDNFFENNLFKVCSDNNFSNLNCILGSSEFILSFVILFFTIIGLKDMIKYYDKFNFEISLLLFNVFQIILIDIIIITPHDFLYELFFLIQPFIISLIIRKFIKIVKNNILRENLIFIVVNIINIIIFTLYILSLLEIFLSNIYLYIRFSSRIFYFLLTVNLAILCRSLINKIEKCKINSESYDLLLKKSITENECKKSEHFVVSFYSNELFYMIRKKQITPLYILNLICSSIQLLFILFKNFILTDYFTKIEYKLISTNEGYIIYYIYLLTFFLNIMINFICFYWIIREQYKSNPKQSKRSKKKILDDDFIKRESISMLSSSENEIFSNDLKKNKNNKSLYSNTFSEEGDKDNQDKYFVKDPNDISNSKDITNEIKEDISFEQLDENKSERKTILSQNAINNNNN